VQLRKQPAILIQPLRRRPVDLVREQLADLLDLQACRLEYGMLLGHPSRLEPDGAVRAGYGRWDAVESGLPEEEAELRVFGNGQSLWPVYADAEAGFQVVRAGTPGGCHAGRSGRPRARATALRNRLAGFCQQSLVCLLGARCDRVCQVGVLTNIRAGQPESLVAGDRLRS
jgi:hypothetical protein